MARRRLTVLKTPGGLGAVDDLKRTAAAVLGPRPPEPGERAAGHGVRAAIVAVHDVQPLAAENIWRVTLAGEPFGRMVTRTRSNTWRLLQLSELDDVQADAIENAGTAAVPGKLLGAV